MLKNCTQECTPKSSSSSLQSTRHFGFKMYIQQLYNIQNPTATINNTTINIDMTIKADVWFHVAQKTYISKKFTCRFCSLLVDTANDLAE